MRKKKKKSKKKIEKKIEKIFRGKLSKLIVSYYVLIKKARKAKEAVHLILGTLR